MQQAHVLQNRIIENYPQLRLHDDLHMKDNFVFPCFGLFKTLAKMVENDSDYVEIIKIDYSPLNGIPTVHLFFSGHVDMLLVNRTFDYYQQLLIAAASE
jgi:hypothetical protein